MKTNIIKLITEAQEMRRLQKEYFRTRSQYILKQCKHKESIVDRLLVEVIAENAELSENSKKPQPESITLFGNSL